MPPEPSLFEGDLSCANPEDDDCRLRSLPQGCQVERPFSKDEWEAFIKCAQKVWASGEFTHNEFEAKRRPDVGDAVIRSAIWKRASLVAYQDEGKERVTLYDPERTGIIVVAALKDGILTSYHVGNFESSLRSKTDVRWLWKPQ